jgi:hypothetical protein
LALATAVAMVALPSGLAQAKFQVGLQDPTLSGLGTTAYSDPGYAAMSAVGGSVIRVGVSWAQVAGSSPTDPNFRWTYVDAAVRRAAAHNLQVLLDVYDAPTWAEGPGLPPATDPNVGVGAWEPNSILFGQFMRDLAQRYSGNTPNPTDPGTALPRVKYFEIWNEPNLGGYVAGPNQVGQFRNLENAGYAAIKGVHSDNLAVIGGLAPIAPPGLYSTHPLTFARNLLCVRQAGKRYKRIKGCPKTNFDVMAVHPYSLSATPTKPAYSNNDILVHDVYKLPKVVSAAARLHTINKGAHPLWVTEWSWFTNPPQTVYGDSPNVAARYVAYSMYEMWKAGASMVIWQLLSDVAKGANTGGGLETAAGVPKPTMSAFGFPFIASVKGRKGYAWGRAPLRTKVKVFIQHEVKGKWRKVAAVKSDGYGVFQAHFKAQGNGTYRAQVAGNGLLSLPYFSAGIPPRRTHAFSFG